MKKIICLLISAGLVLLGPLSSLSGADLTRAWGNTGRLVDNTGVLGRFSSIQFAPLANGGSVVAWSTAVYDSPVSRDRIYLQKYDANGNPAWSYPVSVSNGYPGRISMVTDSSDNIYIAWEDWTNGSIATDIYAQKIDSSGAKQWTSGGVVVCNAAEAQARPIIDLGDSGGAVIGWLDNRSRTTYYYAQKLDSNGSPSWTSNGVQAIDTGATSLSSAAFISDGAGGAYVAWIYNTGNSDDVLAKRLQSSDGSAASGWSTMGNTICGVSGDQSYPYMLSDGGTGALIAWIDPRSGSDEIVLQQVNADGSVDWAADGVKAAASAGVVKSFIAARDGTDYFLVWPKDPGSRLYDLLAQKVNSSGVSQWGTVTLAAHSDSEIARQVVGDGSGGAIIGYTREDQATRVTAAYVQKLNGAGSTQWGTGQTLVAPPTGFSQSIGLVSDGQGSAIAYWNDRQANSKYEIIYANQLNSSGGLAWAATEVVAANNGIATKDVPFVIAKGDPATQSNLESLYVWKDWRGYDSMNNTFYPGVFAQRMDQDGERLLAFNLGSAGTSSQYFDYVAACRTSDGNYIEAYVVRYPGPPLSALASLKVDEDISAVWLDGNGDPQATLMASNSSPLYSQPCIVPDSTGGGIVAYTQIVGGNGDTPYVYALAVDTDGTLREGGTPLRISEGTNDAFPSIAYIGKTAVSASGSRAMAEVVQNNERAWVAWDHRDYNGLSSIRVQQTGGTATSYKWGEEISLGTENSQYWPDIAKSGDHEAIIVWSEYISVIAKYVIKAQKLGYAGVSGAGFSAFAPVAQPTEEAPTAQWASAVTVSDPSQDALYPKVAVLPNGAIVVVWEGGTVQAQAQAGAMPSPPFSRPEPTLVDPKVYMQLLTSGGEKILASGDFTIATDADNTRPNVGALGNDDAVVAWVKNDSNHGEVRTAAFFGLPASTTTTTTTTTTSTTTSTTTTIRRSIVIDPQIDRVGQELKFARRVSLQAESNTVYGQDIQPGATVKFINRKTGKVIVAKNVQVASDGLSAQFDIDMPSKTDTDALGSYDIQVINPDGGSYTLSNSFTIEYPEGEIFFYPTRLTESAIKSAAPQDQPRVAYSLSADKEVDIYIYDVRSMKVVYHRKYAAGSFGGQRGYNEIIWDGKTDFGSMIANGSYVLQAFSGGRMIGQTYFVVTD